MIDLGFRPSPTFDDDSILMDDRLGLCRRPPAQADTNLKSNGDRDSAVNSKFNFPRIDFDSQIHQQAKTLQNLQKLAKRKAHLRNLAKLVFAKPCKLQTLAKLT